MGRDRFRLKALQERLKRIQAEPFSQHRFESEKVLLAEIETSMLREEMFLHQRSRVNWLSFGDKNTAFFHASINQRRQRNQLLKLKSSRGEWITDEEGINDQSRGFLMGLFTGSSDRSFSEVLSVEEHYDALLFLRAELQNCKNVKAILDAYGVATGQRINLDKSGMSFETTYELTRIKQLQHLV
ncbi:hypothetical protein RHGRI_024835 [Rhododendron griersonianum]|uniref:Uncharacterized protein n=1 Tax=Rhododendron griersonianum TaxID=479676 RepID=A0AAV6J8V7_9ERIC|nr:hypothetical protein RHGRI_024835 [Rhododendron griersonianum]